MRGSRRVYHEFVAGRSFTRRLVLRSRRPARPLPDCSEIERVVSETRDELSATLRFHTHTHVRVPLRSVNQIQVIV